MPSVTVTLNISPEEYLRYYKGSAKQVLAHTFDGRSVSFPANILQRFLTHEGIQGQFVIEFDSEGHFKSVKAISR
ncbi:DUF2835 domain-containing protein [Zooshikella harenae]|uniref:DUF2835 domain-containing protein n=1 Tax=Zooshikella harenae TaxID=2827238 RepID=A0ABS5ZA59_9GAMM|nr:DUF2835 domain-containing protein [Zooshikella harenae]MBU2710175.1 DUF2835 domain-containing protein [Zooshikella harenae]